MVATGQPVCFTISFNITFISQGMQLLLTLFALKVLKFEDMASADPIGNLSSDSPYRSPQSPVLRLAIAAAIYLVLGN